MSGRVAKLAQVAAEGWMARQGAGIGFALIDTVADEYSTVQLGHRRHTGARPGAGQGLGMRADVGATRGMSGRGGPSSPMPGLPPAKPIPLKERAALVFVERARIDVKDGAFVAIDAEETRIHVPIGGIACLMLEPGACISHAAVSLAAQAGTLVTWVGEGGVRLYSAGQPGGARADRLLWQASLALDDAARLRVVRKMFALRFGEDPPRRRSVDQLRGIEGQRVRHASGLIARQHGVDWKRRKYDPGDWNSADVANRCLSAATSCLHGLSEAAVLAPRYASAIGFLHIGRPRSFVYDIADLYKLDTVVPEALRVAAKAQKGQLDTSPERAVRLACCDVFRRSGLLKKIIPRIEEVLNAGDLPRHDPPPEALGPAFLEGASGDDGHRG